MSGRVGLMLYVVLTRKQCQTRHFGDDDRIHEVETFVTSSNKTTDH